MSDFSCNTDVNSRDQQRDEYSFFFLHYTGLHYTVFYTIRFFTLYGLHYTVSRKIREACLFHASSCILKFMRRGRATVRRYA